RHCSKAAPAQVRRSEPRAPRPVRRTVAQKRRHQMGYGCRAARAMPRCQPSGRCSACHRDRRNAIPPPRHPVRPLPVPRLPTHQARLLTPRRTQPRQCAHRRACHRPTPLRYCL
ncbi:hypothetical protein DFQ30_003004, partial [Apophysomyces sp. BC1015]